MKKLLLAVALTSMFAAGASAQNSVPPRDPPFGKGMGNDALYEPNSGTVGQSYRSSSASIPRDPPFGKGNPGNDTFNLPNSADSWWHWR